MGPGPRRPVDRPRSEADLLKREMPEVGTLAGVLDRESTDPSLSIDVKLCVLVEILGVDDAASPELDAPGRPRPPKRCGTSGGGGPARASRY